MHPAWWCLVWLSSWQPASPSCTCLAYTVLPRPCCRHAVSIDRGHPGLHLLAFRGCKPHGCAGLPSHCCVGIKGVCGTGWNAAERPRLRAYRTLTTQLRTTASHEAVRRCTCALIVGLSRVDKICLSWRKIVHELQSPSEAKFSILENLNVCMNIFPALPT